MKMGIGRKLIIGFFAVSMIAAITGIIGLYFIHTVAESGDIILNEKVPVGSQSMEGSISLLESTDSICNYLLSKDEKELESIRETIDERIKRFGDEMKAIIEGDQQRGVIAVDERSEIGRLAREIRDMSGEYNTRAHELMASHSDSLRLEEEVKRTAMQVDSQALELIDRLEAYEREVLAEVNQELDDRFVSAMEATKYVLEMDVLALEYVDQEESAHSKIRERFESLHRKLEAQRDSLPTDIISLYENYHDLVSRSGGLFDSVDSRIEDDREAEKQNVIVNQITKDAEDKLGELEILTVRDMEAAMDVAHQAENSARITLIVLIILAFGLGLAIGIIITRGITTSISACIEFAQRIAGNDLTQRIEINTRDETKTLADSLNDMAGNLSTMVGRIRDASTSVASAADEISAASTQITRGAESQASAADETSSSMEQMSVNIQSVAQNAEGLSANVDETTSSIQQMGTNSEGVAKNAESMAANVAETSSTIEQMVVTINSTAENVERANMLSRQASEEAKNGGDAVLETVSGMREIGAMMEEISGVIQGLGKRSEAIGGIVAVIEEIADQTNLLALNAAIEAARAGEAGRGFAVVADEVRKLAERSVKATKEIADVIREVQDETGNAVTSTQQGAETARNGLKLADTAGNAIQRIIKSVEDATTIMDSIAEATAEQNAAAKNVTIAVEEMNRLTTSVTTSTSEQASGIAQVVSAAESMAQMTEQVRNATSEQKQGGENVVRAVENINAIAKSNLTAVEQLSRSAKDMAGQSEGLQELVREFRVN